MSARNPVGGVTKFRALDASGGFQRNCVVQAAIDVLAVVVSLTLISAIAVSIGVCIFFLF